MSEVVAQRADENWYRVDLHVHSAASADFCGQDDALVSLLQDAEAQGIALLALTDHHSVAGYERLRQDLAFLQRREQRGRLKPEEAQRLAQYRHLLSIVTVLPGFEYTSAEDLTLLAIYPPDGDPHELKATLWQLNVPHGAETSGLVALPDALPAGEAATEISESGGLVILSHTILLEDGSLAALTRQGRSGPPIALPADLRVHAFELDPHVGTPAGAPAGSVLVRGSDAHLTRASRELMSEATAVGSCFTELLLPAPSFAALRACLAAGDTAAIRLSAAADAQLPDDHSVQLTLDESLTAAQAYPHLAALANLGGGTLELLLPHAPHDDGRALLAELERSANVLLDPQPQLTLLPLDAAAGTVRLQVTAAAPPPYLAHDGIVYVRRAGVTVPADRQELLQLCREGLTAGAPATLDSGEEVELPRSGVEIIAAQRRSSVWQYEVRDLRTTAGVTRDRAEGLWAYAIERHEALRDGRVDLRSDVRWQGRRGLWRTYRQGARPKYDLVSRDVNGVIEHVFYGVSDWGLGAAWLDLIHAADTGLHAAPQPAAAEEVAAAPAEAAVTATAVLLTETVQAPAAADDVSGWGEQRPRWRGRGGLARVVRLDSGQVRFDLLMQEQDNEAPRSFLQVPLDRLSAAWLKLIRVEPPTTGIEIAEFLLTEQGEGCFRFRNMRSGDVSANPWRHSQIDAGTVREYAARTFLADRTLNEENVRWLGNIGYLRPMRSQVDLVLIDETGVRRIFYAARRDELSAEWRDLLTAYGEVEPPADAG